MQHSTTHPAIYQFHVLMNWGRISAVKWVFLLLSINWNCKSIQIYIYFFTVSGEMTANKLCYSKIEPRCLNVKHTVMMFFFFFVVNMPVAMKPFFFLFKKRLGVLGGGDCGKGKSFSNRHTSSVRVSKKYFSLHLVQKRHLYPLVLRFKIL